MGQARNQCWVRWVSGPLFPPGQNPGTWPQSSRGPSAATVRMEKTLNFELQGGISNGITYRNFVGSPHFLFTSFYWQKKKAPDGLCWKKPFAPPLTTWSIPPHCKIWGTPSQNNGCHNLDGSLVDVYTCWIWLAIAIIFWNPNFPDLKWGYNRGTK